MIATSLSLRSPLPTRPITSTRSSSPLLMAVLFNETSSAGGLSLRGHFYRVFKGTLSKSFNIKLCLSDSSAGLETGLKDGIELVKYRSDILAHGFPTTLLQRRDGKA